MPYTVCVCVYINSFCIHFAYLTTLCIPYNLHFVLLHIDRTKQFVDTYCIYVTHQFVYAYCMCRQQLVYTFCIYLSQFVYTYTNSVCVHFAYTLHIRISYCYIQVEQEQFVYTYGIHRWMTVSDLSPEEVATHEQERGTFMELSWKCHGTGHPHSSEPANI